MPNPDLYIYAWFAMGTLWELRTAAERPEAALRSVGEAVEAEVERIEELLSFYRETSDLRALNATAALGPVRVDPRLFALLQRAHDLCEATGGAFDPTIGPLLRCWGFVGSSGAMPSGREIEAARAVVGMCHVHLNADEQAVRFDRPGVELEFGAIGKGYAIERAVELLREEFEIHSALLHGGTSTIYALGAPPGEEAWPVAVRRPYGGEDDTITTIPLRDRALSVSAPHNKSFEHGGRRYGHVLDPRTGSPQAGSVVAAVATESATESDALSTALLVLGAPGIPLIRAIRPTAMALVGTYEGAELLVDGAPAE